MENDVALIKVKKMDMSSPDVEFVCLPEQNERPAKDLDCFIAGWGTWVLPSFMDPDSQSSDPYEQYIYGDQELPEYLESSKQELQAC